MSLKFSANLTFMFQEVPTLCGRYQAAKDAGFRFVESAFPHGVDKGEVTKAKDNAGVEQILMNAHQGDPAKGDLGISAIPGREEEFKDSLERSIQYAHSLKCQKIHIMAGLKGDYSIDEMEKTYLNNLQHAASRLQQENIVGLIEPINNRISVPKYFLSDFNKAVEYIKFIDSPNLKLQLDMFHLQVMEGNLTNNIKHFLPFIGHIQIAQVPARGEPNTSGEINYRYILQLLLDSGYDGYIGLEYKPSGDTVKGLKWLEEFGYKL
ncbi:hypothetical protein LOTGIDRAFT_218771 [Lottia gigantea]|uniref:Putative hydroxypyruvate isomerase n=1 Tax=Lottia gigantea TaxID=225164 RepID=V4A3V5_LOTGI|nr:hypothetical protein LOTGIDRAFT_218771 [Lottia gigantea]ESO89670.1 hypothetical protein LOTGIDRAFT_218771 [Lottia gigantea]